MSDDERPTGYRSGDLEAAATAAREETLAMAEAARREAQREAEHRQALLSPPTGAARSVDDQASTSDSTTSDSTASDSTAASSSAASSSVAGVAEAATSATSGLAGQPVTAEPTSDGGEAQDSPTGEGDGRDHGGGVLAFFRELPVLLAVAFLLAFLLRTFVVQVFYIPSGSMIPTLEVNDRIVVEKISYLFREPARGEVVVFEGDTPIRTLDDSFVAKVTRGVGQFLGLVPANARDFVKRVIGLPGDEIVIEDGVVFVNGVALPEPYAVEDLRDFGPFSVPEGKLFFLGDNRPSSADSRIPSALGYVDSSHVVGRAMVVVWPFDHFDGIGTPEYPAIP